MKGAGKEEMDGLMEWVDIGKKREGECSLDSHIALLCCLASVISSSGKHEIPSSGSMASMHFGGKMKGKKRMEDGRKGREEEEREGEQEEERKGSFELQFLKVLTQILLSGWLFTCWHS